MKNTLKIMLFVALATLTFASCNKENTPAVQQDTVLDFTMDYANFSGNDTKGTKTTWENGDLVYMIFMQDGATEYDYKNYVKMQFNGTEWAVIAGQDVLNNLPVGKGKVSACHHTGITDPVLSTDETKNVFPNDNKACFALSAHDIEYTKTTGKITAALKFRPSVRFQFNIKDLDFERGKYSLNIYDGSKDVLGNSFDKSFFYSYGAGGYSGPYVNIPAQKGIDTKEISFFVTINIYSIDDTKKSVNSDGICTFNFNPTFELRINIGGKYYYATRTINGKTYTEYKAYSLKGPTATDEQIKLAKTGADLGNGWKLK